MYINIIILSPFLSPSLGRKRKDVTKGVNFDSSLVLDNLEIPKL